MLHLIRVRYLAADNAQPSRIVLRSDYEKQTVTLYRDYSYSDIIDQVKDYLCTLSYTMDDFIGAATWGAETFLISTVFRRIR